jgi:hypothetical protein
MHRTHRLACAAGLLAALVAATEGRASLIGDNVTLTETANSYVVTPGPSAVVGNGAEFLVVLQNNLVPRFSVDVAASSVTFSFAAPTGFFVPAVSSFTLGDLDFAGAPGGIVGISSATVGTPATFTTSFTADSLTLNITGGLWNQGSSVTVTFDVGAAAVPAPASFALLGAGLVGLVATRRRRPAQA